MMTYEQLSRLRECLLSTSVHLANAAYELEMFAEELPRSKGKISPEVLEQDIGVLELSVRSMNCLKNNGIHTIKDLVEIPKEHFRSIKHFGIRSRNEVNEVLHNLGFEGK
jgi:DNA-directed RNA polymerase alpha subunit